MTRLREKYFKEVVPALMKQFDYDNVMRAPRVQKVVINMGVGQAFRIRSCSTTP